jgi:sorting nexin-9/18/33
MNEDMTARCETVLNTTMAEMETYHTQKSEDFSTFTIEHLDGEIAFYELVLSRLKNARRTFDLPQFDQLAESSRQPSIYERELENPRLSPKLLKQPCPHVFDSAPMRPVSVALQEGVGLFLGPAARESLLGKFW